MQEQVATWQEERRVSKYAEGLEQLPATRTIPMDPKQVWRDDGLGLSSSRSSSMQGEGVVAVGRFLLQLIRFFLGRERERMASESTAQPALAPWCSPLLPCPAVEVRGVWCAGEPVAQPVHGVHRLGARGEQGWAVSVLCPAGGQALYPAVLPVCQQQALPSSTLPPCPPPTSACRTGTALAALARRCATTKPRAASTRWQSSWGPSPRTVQMCIAMPPMRTTWCWIHTWRATSATGAST